MYLYGVRSPSNLGIYIPGLRRRLHGVADDGDSSDGSGVSVDPTLLIGGIGALALAFFMFGKKAAPVLIRRRRARLKSKLAALPAF
jgi:hypothetical protein